MKNKAHGRFAVKTSPVAQEECPGGTTLGRFTLEKTYHGPLEASARGEMLTAGTAVPGSAGYVAIESVEGVLAGRHGTFVLQHLGSMTGGEQHLRIAVVPDSGTGDLVGLTGELDITISEGEHFYDLTYDLPDKH